jgi:hydroxymethylpyrimidine pyrophosphatase-like HAD family hydrolase
VCAVVTDLDGTIVRADQAVGAATCRAVTDLRARGVPLVVATARTPAGLSVLGPILPSVSLPAICQPLAFGVYSGSEWLLRPGYYAARGKWPSGPRQVALTSVVARARAMGICHAGYSSADLAALLQEGDAGSAPVSFSYDATDVLDAVPYGIAKGTGLVRGCDLIGLDPARAVGFGDPLNDLPKFSVLECAVAMANAQEEVHARAGATTGIADEDGFAAHLAKLSLISNRRRLTG